MRLPSFTDVFETQHNIVLLPDHYFYTQRVTLPEGIEPSEIRNFAEYTMEESSPFSLDQLYWGFLTNQETPSSLLLYAAYKPRLKADDIIDFDDAYHVLPAFVSHSGLSVASPSCFLCQYEDSLSALHFVPGETYPVQVESIQFNERESDDEDEDVVEENVFIASRKLIHSDALEQPGIFTCIDVRVEDETLVFSHAYQVDESSDLKMLPDNHVSDNTLLWNADIRDEGLKQEEIKTRKYGQYAWSALQASAVAVALIIFMQLFNLTGNMLVDGRFEKISTDNAAVKLVENQQKSLNTLKEFKNIELQPFAMLDILNSTRPSSIYFKSAEGYSGMPLTIMGIAPTVAQLDDYARQLELNSNLEYASVKKQKVVLGSGVNFTMEASFKPLGSSGDPLAFIKSNDGK